VIGASIIIMFKIWQQNHIFYSTHTHRHTRTHTQLQPLSRKERGTAVLTMWNHLPLVALVTLTSS